jgi:hypothetical protein
MSKVEKLQVQHLLTKRMSWFLLSCSFPMLFVWVCIVLLSIIVSLLSTFSFPMLFVWVFTFFVFVNIFLQQSIDSFRKLCFLSMETKLWSCNAPPTTPKCSYIMFRCFLNVTFEYPNALGGVLQNFSMNSSTNLQHSLTKFV